MPEQLKFTANDLKAWREQMGLSQRAAVDVLGCSRGAYVKWEAGTQDIPLYIGFACAAIAAGMDVFHSGNKS